MSSDIETNAAGNLFGFCAATWLRRLVSVGLALTIASAPCFATQRTWRLHTASQPVGQARAWHSSDNVVTNSVTNVVITITPGSLEPSIVTLLLGQSLTWKNESGMTQTLRFEREYHVNLPIVQQTDPEVVTPNSSKNTDTKVRGLSFQRGRVEQVLGPGDSFMHTFVVAGSYAFSVAGFVGNVMVLPKFFIVAAGDIARCSNLAGAHGTANLIKTMPDVPVLTLGDLAYSSGTDAEFQNCYAPTWGQFKNRTHPSPGNHEYRTAGAAGYFRYFGTPEYYTWDFGGWHLISLNSEIDYSASSPQMNWLRADLTASRARCKLAYWHRPRYSSGVSHGSSSSLSGLWSLLQSYSVTLALTGHEHNYERFASQDANGKASKTGIREFVVGTGGAGFYRFNATPEPNSEFRLTNVYGVLKLELLPTAYRWQFIAIDGGVKDSGTAQCN
jgi:plastocyanin